MYSVQCKYLNTPMWVEYKPNVQKSAYVSGIVYRNIILYVPQYPNVSRVVYMNIIVYVPQYPNVSGVQPMYRRVHLWVE